jgi:hypothetical protein
MNGLKLKVQTPSSWLVTLSGEHLTYHTLDTFATLYEDATEAHQNEENLRMLVRFGTLKSFEPLCAWRLLKMIYRTQRQMKTMLEVAVVIAPRNNIVGQVLAFISNFIDLDTPVQIFDNSTQAKEYFYGSDRPEAKVVINKNLSGKTRRNRNLEG